MAAATPQPDPLRSKPATTPIGLGSLIRAVRRYSLLMFIFVLLAGVAGALVYFFLPLPKNTARMIYLVKSQPEHNLHANVFPQRGAAEFRALQMNIITGRSVINAALSEPGVSSLPLFEQDRSIDPIQYLQTNLKVDFKDGGENMRVTLEGNESSEILHVIKAVNSAYTKAVVSQEHRDRHSRMLQLKEMQTEYQDRVKMTKASINNILIQLNSSDPISQSIRERYLNGMVGQSDAELQRLHIRQRELMAQQGRITDEAKIPVALRQPVEPALVNAFVQGDPALRKLNQDLDETLAMLKRYEGVVKPGVEPPAKFQTLNTSRADLQGRIDALLPQLRSFYEKQLKEELKKGEQTLLTSIKNQLDLIKQQQQSIQNDIEKCVKEMKGLKDQAARVEDLQVEVTNNQAISTRISNDLVTMQTELSAPPRVVEWDPPYVFAGIEGQRRAKYTGITVAAFLVLGLALCQWLEIRHRRIQTLVEVTDGLGLQILGTVPAMPKGGVTARSNWPHLLTEAVNTTRTMLLSGPHAESTKTLLITSAMSGEGKTSLTTHLAVSLAGAGRRVLLIDADMRRPAVHKVLGLESKPGLAELLVAHARLEDVTQTCKIAGLHLVPAGVYSREAAAALSGDVFRDLLREAAIGYDFVLVDSPPILPVADALAISKNVDGVLISVMQDLSRYGAVQTACQRLSLVGANVLGVVVSGVKTSGGYYYYYYDERYSKADPVAAAAEPAPTAIVPAGPPSA